jgi:ABC-type polysaccharide/polyol phosphate transport system ATPase subunit
MSDVVIEIHGLGKRYRVGERERYFALRDVLARMVTAPFRSGPAFAQKAGYGSAGNGSANWLWALKDVTCDIQQGEVIGLIGRNGAGKSTLLKLLARVTKPTAGWAEVRGRVGSLLEVGTGFHPELTGRENVFLSGAILGMKKAEIQRKFDEIVAFSEVERFLDTPLKHYSSGMQMRLAFAVAAHLEPEILLIDEVLAVGDLNFQKKCLGKMGDVARSGRTIVFVSHQMNQIRRLCERVYWLDHGQIRKSGRANETIGAYEAEMLAVSNPSAASADHRGMRAQFMNWAIDGAEQDASNILASTGRIRLKFGVSLHAPIRIGHHGIALYNGDRQLVWGTAVDNLELPAGTHAFVHELPTLPLRPGPYTWKVSLYDDGNLLDAWECVPEMLVATQPVTHSKDEWAGLLNIPDSFSVISE